MNLSGLSDKSAGRKPWEHNFSITLNHTTLHPFLTDSKRDELLQKFPQSEYNRLRDREALKSNHLSEKFNSIQLAQMIRHGKPSCRDINGVVRHLQSNFSLCPEPEELPAPPVRSMNDEVTSCPFARDCSYVQELPEPQKKGGARSHRRYEITAPIGERLPKEEDQKQAKKIMARNQSSRPKNEEKSSGRPSVSSGSIPVQFQKLTSVPRSLRSVSQKLRQITGRSQAEAQVVPEPAPVVENEPPASVKSSGHRRMLASQIPPETQQTVPPRCGPYDVHEDTDHGTIVTSKPSASTRPDPAGWLKKKAKHGKRDPQLVAQDMFVFRNQ